MPEHSWEAFGCEDPRVTRFDDKYYIFYTALSTYPFLPPAIKLGLAITDDLRDIAEKHQITPFNAKAMALFPRRMGGKLTAILTANTDFPPARASPSPSSTRSRRCGRRTTGRTGTSASTRM